MFAAGRPGGVEVRFGVAQLCRLEPRDPCAARFRRRRAVLRRRTRSRTRQRPRVETQAARHRVDRHDMGDDADGLDIPLFAETAGDDAAIPPFAEATGIVAYAMNDLDHDLR